MKKIAILALLSTLLTMFTGCACEHEWEQATSELKVCNKCLEEKFVECSHNWVEATCTEPKHCTICGDSEGYSEEHIWTQVDGLAYCDWCERYASEIEDAEASDSEEDVSDESSNDKDLQNIGFQNMQGYTTWIAIEGYDFTDGYISLDGYRLNNKAVRERSRDLVFDEKYFTTAKYQYDETIELNNRYAYNVIDNDTIDRDQFGNMMFITERKVSDNGKWVIIKTSNDWYIPVEMIQWTTDPEYDSEDKNFRLYLK